MRDYGAAGQIGLEPTLAEYIATMVDVFRGVRRVLRDDGTLWLNIGDSYCASARGNSPTDWSSSGLHGASTSDKYRDTLASGAASKRDTTKAGSGLKPKDLMMVPARLAIALQDDGWYLRSDIIWAKPNPMPESVRDRPTSAHEHIFLLTKQARYFYDADAVREDATCTPRPETSKYHEGVKAVATQHGGIASSGLGYNRPENGRNQRNVWTITTHGFPEAHFATFPPEIPRRCIKAGSREGDTILDPFGGAMTTMLEASRLNRNGIAIELNPAYAEIGRRRLYEDAPLLADIA